MHELWLVAIAFVLPIIAFGTQTYWLVIPGLAFALTAVVLQHRRFKRERSRARHVYWE